MRGISTRRLRLTKKGRYLAGLAILLAGFAASSYAYWTAFGSGEAQTHLPDPQAATLEPATASAELYPGGTASIALTGFNPNPYVVHIPSLQLDTNEEPDGFDVDGDHPDCSDDVLSYTTQDNGGNGWDIPPKVGNTNGSMAITLPGALAMSVAADNGCQGATFSVHLVAGS
jgi:hypothetical protein